jgi:hypothetical protein
MKEGTVPIPGSASPIAGLELVQKIRAPGLPIKVKGGTTAPSYTVVSVLIDVDGIAFTSNEKLVLSVHCPGSGVNTYVPFTRLLTTVGFHVPVIPFVDVTGKEGTIEPIHTD